MKRFILFSLALLFFLGIVYVFGFRERRVDVYFNNTIENPDSTSCEEVYAVSRDVSTILSSHTPRAALEALLRGPTKDEVSQGYFSSIPEGVRIQAFVRENSTAYVTFSPELQQGVAGSCRVLAIRAQIERTLQEFPDIVTVIIRVEGVPQGEELQP